MHTPVDVTGIEPARHIGFQDLASLPSAPCDSFPDYRSANQAEGGRTPFCWSSASGSRDARPEPSYIGELLLQLASDCRSRGISLSACLRGGTFDGLCLLS